MLVYILDKNFKRAGIIDSASSNIFTKRYNDNGDFQIYAAASEDIVNLVTTNPYVYRDNDDTIYCIEQVNIASNVDNGQYITISGPNIASILNRRIIWNQTNSNSTAEKAIRKFIDENAITTDSQRILPKLKLGPIKGFTDTLRIQRTGDNLLETVQELCKAFNYGYKMIFDGNELIFELYQGQEKNVYFSPEYDNLISSTYDRSSANYKNIAVVAGEGEGLARTRTTSGDTSISGMERYEVYIDANDLTTNEGQISAEDYEKILKTRGTEKLTEHKMIEAFSCEVLSENTYILGKDYNLGDIVNIKTEYGISAKAQIIETIECEDENGYSFIPTFGTWEVQ